MGGGRVVPKKRVGNPVDVASRGPAQSVEGTLLAGLEPPDPIQVFLVKVRRRRHPGALTHLWTPPGALRFNADPRAGILLLRPVKDLTAQASASTSVTEASKRRKQVSTSSWETTRGGEKRTGCYHHPSR